MACGDCVSGTRTLEDALFKPQVTVEYAPTSSPTFIPGAVTVTEEPFSLASIEGLPWWVLVIIGFALHSLLK